jgi:acetate---CoA ligase (ADP-forming)
VAMDALLDQCGVIRVNTVKELFDLALAFSKNPIPRGNRLGILTNAGGPAIMATDAAISMGLEVSKLSERAVAELRKLLPPEAALSNPVDMTPKASPRTFAACARFLLEDDTIDSLLVIFVPPMMVSPTDVVAGIDGLRKEFTKPILGVIMATEDAFDELNEKQPGHLAIYHFPEPAVQALATMERHRHWRERPVGEVRESPAEREAARELLEPARARGEVHLSTPDAFRLLECYGIPVARSAVATTIGELEAQAKQVRFPVVLKAIAPGLVHKTEAGGVAVDIRTIEELIGAARRMREAIGGNAVTAMAATGATTPAQLASSTPLSFLMQEYVRGGREVIVGMTQDPNFGPLVMFGLGGIYVETVKDVTFRVPPLTDVDAREMIRQIRGYRLLEGVRGEPPIDFEALAVILERFSQMVEDLPQMAEVEVNPLMVFPEARDFCAVDARVRLK